MKRGKKMLALLLMLCLSFTMAAPAYAAGGRGMSRGSRWQKTQPKTQQDSKAQQDINTGETELLLVEDETTVENGDLLRAATYEVKSADNGIAGQAEGDQVKYFPVTMFNYDQKAYNNTLKAQEYSDELTTWNGIYMGNDSGSYNYNATVTYGGEVNGRTVHYEKVTNPISNGSLNLEADAQYVLVCGSQGGNSSPTNGLYVAVGVLGSNVVSVENYGNGDYANPLAGAAVWTISKSNNGYNFKNGSRYLSISSNGASISNSASAITVSAFSSSSDNSRIMLGNGSTYMNKSGGYNHTVGSNFGIYSAADDDGSSFYLYKVVSGSKTVEGQQTKNLNYAAYNRWTAALGSKSGNQVYQGLAKNKLDSSGNIQFDYPDAGLFTSNEFAGKSIYTNVGLPFEYDSMTQTYSFNAKTMGAWFEGEAASNKNLTYSTVPQAFVGNQQDDNVAGWFPFNDSTNTGITSCVAPNLNGSQSVMAKKVSSPDYYFGMAASVDFTMTSDGKLKNGEDIKFKFSGDDDVWVFIDGTLVLDIGGIHNRTNGEINFADGTWKITQTYKSTAQAVDVNNGTANTSGDLWTTLGVADLTTFAATETHTLTVFYLERGAGASNCEITFNLPMKDYVNVTKNATKDSQGSALTEAEQQTVNNMDFTYTIYKDDQPYAGKTYTLINATTGNAIATASTTSAGQFTLKNGQTARFTTEFSKSGETWKVVETDPGAAFVADRTAWTSSSITINGTANVSSEGLTSNAVMVTGSDEASGTLSFLCENIMDAELANPGIVTAEDRIVIDYGLPVQIDVKKNDLYRADSYEIVGINGTVIEDGENYTDSTTKNDDGSYTTSFGTVKISDAANGILEYQLNKQLTDVEEITYIVAVKGQVLTHPEIDGSTETNEKTVYAKGTVYVIPATSMYYEENFLGNDGSTMIQYTSGWKSQGTASNGYQEPGVVKDQNDSPYGSDAAYMDDSGDSNGTSMYASTVSASQSFQYTFTGTGTSFFARTTNNSGYMRVIVTGGEGDTRLIDTRFLNDGENTLYNIPVYTIDKLEYGTYTVKVTVAKNNSSTKYGTDFWLDGIRIQQPMNQNSEKNSIAEAAYSDDGEANVNIETLRDKLIDASGFDDNGNLAWEDGFAVLTDTNGNITAASDYQSIGPKEEVYLNNGQKISFTLEEWDTNHKLYLGMKAPMGNAAANINGHEVTVNNTVDCYYDISSFVTVDSDGNAKIEISSLKDNIVSVTNIKTTGAVKFEIIKGEDVSEGEGQESGNEDLEALTLDNEITSDTNDVNTASEAVESAAESKTESTAEGSETLEASQEMVTPVEEPKASVEDQESEPSVEESEILVENQEVEASAEEPEKVPEESEAQTPLLNE